MGLDPALKDGSGRDGKERASLEKICKDTLYFKPRNCRRQDWKECAKERPLLWESNPNVTVTFNERFPDSLQLSIVLGRRKIHMDNIWHVTLLNKEKLQLSPSLRQLNHSVSAR